MCLIFLCRQFVSNYLLLNACVIILNGFLLSSKICRTVAYKKIMKKIE